ncbi:hypothetical protein [Aliiroseovarius sp. xm-g-7]|uniref:hypothetical protein n=1 Tax=Aliiroseovarius sp. xm-g-7 TaxID=2651826 RepID=UPI001569BAF7|nr:hypothetical protein [Aliiroseovarius sp. xm-g-7]
MQGFATGYQGSIDGKWGRGTQAALDEASSYFYLGENTSADEVLAYILEPYEFWGEGGDCGEDCSFIENNSIDMTVANGDNSEPEELGANKSDPATQVNVTESGRTEYVDLPDFHCKSVEELPEGIANLRNWDASANASESQFILSFRILNSLIVDGERAPDEFIESYETAVPDTPLRNFLIAYMYWQKGEISNFVNYAGKAAEMGEPNSSFLLGLLALGVMPLNYSLWDGYSDFEFTGLEDLPKALECLKAASVKPTLGDGRSLDVGDPHGNGYTMYFVKDAPLIASSLLLFDDTFLERTAETSSPISWAGISFDAEEAKLILDNYRRDISTGAEKVNIAENLLIRAETSLSQLASTQENALPSFVSGSQGSYSVDLQAACDGVNRNESEIGTKILGVNIAASLCENIYSMIDRGFDCNIGFQKDFGSGRLEFGSAKCQNADAVVQFETGSIYPSESETMSATKFWSENKDDMLNGEIKNIRFNCNAMNSCSNTGRDLAQFIVDNVGTVSEMNPVYVDQFFEGGWRAEGVSDFGEKIIVLGLEYLEPSLKIGRGALDQYKPGGMSLE